jgi:transposase InsO family protein
VADKIQIAARPDCLAGPRTNLIGRELAPDLLLDSRKVNLTPLAAHRWTVDYNEQRPHESLGDLTPAEYREQAASGSTFEVSG